MLYTLWTTLKYSTLFEIFFWVDPSISQDVSDLLVSACIAFDELTFAVDSVSTGGCSDAVHISVWTGDGGNRGFAGRGVS